MRKLSEQLEIFGLNEVVRRIEMEPVRASERKRLLRRVEVTHEMMTALPAREDLSFMHAGFCQTCLPHSRPTDNRNVWRRSSGRFTLIVSPGVVEDIGPDIGSDGSEHIIPTARKPDSHRIQDSLLASGLIHCRPVLGLSGGGDGSGGCGHA